MASIYIIKNTVNNKVYIGQTTQPINIRFTNHKMASRVEDTKFYRAIRKYGEDKFYIELLEEDVLIEKLNEREQYWIQFFNSYYNGYNSTLGGDGIHYLDYDLIYNYWSQGYNLTDISKICTIGRDAISRILRGSYNITSEEIKKRGYISNYKLTPEFIIEQWHKGLTPNQISTQFGGDINTIKKVLYTIGLTDEDFKIRSNEHQRILKDKEIIELWQNGLNITQIGSIGGNRQTIRKVLLENGVTEKDIDKRKRQTCNRNAKPVVQLSLSGEYITTFSSAKVAGESLGKPSTSICGCCNHKPKYKTAYGYKWLFLEEYNKNGDKNGTQ